MNWVYVTHDSASPCYLSGPFAVSDTWFVGGGYCTSSSASSIVVSTDAASWSPPNSMGSQAQALVSCTGTNIGILNANFSAAAYGGGRYAVVACRHVLSSVNGADWGLATGAFRTSGSTLKLEDIAYTGERFVAVGGPDILISR